MPPGKRAFCPEPLLAGNIPLSVVQVCPAFAESSRASVTDLTERSQSFQQTLGDRSHGPEPGLEVAIATLPEAGGFTRSFPFLLLAVSNPDPQG